MSLYNKTLPRNRYGMTKRQMLKTYPDPVDTRPSKELYDHIHWIRSDWKDKSKCAICGEKVSPK